jgi:hypothetical protein
MNYSAFPNILTNLHHLFEKQAPGTWDGGIERQAERHWCPEEKH